MGPRADGGRGGGVQVSSAGGAVATAPGSWASAEGREGLSVLCAGRQGHGVQHLKWGAGTGWGRPYRKVNASW